MFLQPMLSFILPGPQTGIYLDIGIMAGIVMVTVIVFALIGMSDHEQDGKCIFKKKPKNTHLRVDNIIFHIHCMRDFNARVQSYKKQYSLFD